MNKHLKKLLETKLIKGGQFLDCFNQSVSDIAGTIKTTIDHSNEYYVTEDMGIEMELIGMLDIKGDDYNKRVYSAEGIAPAQNARSGGNLETKIAEPFIVASRGREPQVMTPKRTEYGKQIRKQYEAHQVSEQRKHIQQLEPRTDGISNTLTSAEKDNYICEPYIEIPANTKEETIRLELGGVCDLSYPNSKTRRGRVQEGGSVSPTLTCGVENSLHRIEPGEEENQRFRIRKLTPRECFRLMDVNDEDIDKMMNAGISQTQLYRLAGNSIVVAVLEKIFDKMFINTDVTEWTLF